MLPSSTEGSLALTCLPVEAGFIAFTRKPSCILEFSPAFLGPPLPMCVLRPNDDQARLFGLS